MSSVKHPNLHLILEGSIKVSDAFSGWRFGSNFYWKLDDVETFANSIARSAIRSLTYTVSNASSSKYTVTFDCDEQFPSTFMEFLKTQPIYVGFDERGYNEWSDKLNFKLFLTLQSAKKNIK